MQRNNTESHRWTHCGRKREPGEHRGQCQRLCLDRGGSSDGEELLKSGKTGNVQQRIRIYLKAVGGRLASSPVRIHFLHHDLVRAADKQGKKEENIWFIFLLGQLIVKINVLLEHLFEEKNSKILLEDGNCNKYCCCLNYNHKTNVILFLLS